VVKKSLVTKRFNLDTSNNGDRKRKDKSIEECVNWFKNTDMFHERPVPSESKYKCTDKNSKNKNKYFGRNIVHFFSIGKISEHVYIFTY